MAELRFSQINLGSPVLPPLVLAFHMVATTSGSGSSESDGSGEKSPGSASTPVRRAASTPMISFGSA